MAAIDSFPLLLSLRVAGLALLFVAPLGLLLAWIQARKRYPGRSLVDAAILLPLVLPPSVTGFYLVLLLGRRGPLGRLLESAFDVRIAFTPTAAVIASAVAALPLMVKTAQPAFEAVPPELENVGRSLGLGPFAVFRRVTLPHAWPGVLAALVLAFARAIGELGATLMLAGSRPGVTNTVPLEIFRRFEGGDDETALAYTLIMTGISFGVVIVASRTFRRRAAS